MAPEAGGAAGGCCRRALVCGWFSVEGGEATAGDLLAADRVTRELAGLGYVVDRATNEGFAEGVRLDDMVPGAYDTVVFSCGPLHGDRIRDLVERCTGARLVAVNVSTVDPELAARFDAVIPRDGAGSSRPDLALATPGDPVPLVGVVRAHPQPEYPDGRHDAVDTAVRRLLRRFPAAVVDFDTRVDPEADPLAAHGRRPAEPGSLAARLDVVVTSRLHGLVLALRAGTPALAVDPVAGGAKVQDQARALGWPAVATPEDLRPQTLGPLLEWCLTSEARDVARAASRRGAAAVEVTAAELRAAVRAGQDGAPAGGVRTADDPRDRDLPARDTRTPATGGDRSWWTTV